jgi:hypothetical protein
MKRHKKNVRNERERKRTKREDGEGRRIAGEDEQEEERRPSTLTTHHLPWHCCSLIASLRN